MKTRKLRIKRKVVVKSRKKGKLNRKISIRRKHRKSRNISKKHNRTRKNRVMRGGGTCEEQLAPFMQFGIYTLLNPSPGKKLAILNEDLQFVNLGSGINNESLQATKTRLYNYVNPHVDGFKKLFLLHRFFVPLI